MMMIGWSLTRMFACGDARLPVQTGHKDPVSRGQAKPLFALSVLALSCGQLGTSTVHLRVTIKVTQLHARTATHLHRSDEGHVLNRVRVLVLQVLKRAMRLVDR